MNVKLPAVSVQIDALNKQTENILNKKNQKKKPLILTHYNYCCMDIMFYKQECFI